MSAAAEDHPALLYLTDDDVRALGLRPAQVRQAVAAAFVKLARSRVLQKPKTAITVGNGHAFQSLSAVDLDAGVAVNKWVGMVPPKPGVTCVNATMQLNDVATGRPLCLMNAQHATALRTAAMSAAAAEILASPDSRSIGFIGAGVQAHSHLDALRDLLPGLTTLRVHSLRPESSRRFAEAAARTGLAASVAAPEELVAESDVIVTTVPGSAGLTSFLDPGWLKPGAFVASVDLGRPWFHAPIRGIDIVCVDDEPMKHYASAGYPVPPLEFAHATLAELVSADEPGKRRAADRAMFFSSGCPVADLAIATVIHAQARARGAGMPLSL